MILLFYTIRFIISLSDSQKYEKTISLANDASKPQQGPNTNNALNYMAPRNGMAIKDHSALSITPKNAHGGVSEGHGGFGFMNARGQIATSYK